MTALVVAGLFFPSLFFSPIVAMVGAGYQTDDGISLYPVIAPALIVVGTVMVRSVRRIDWDDPTIAIPVFLTMVLLPLTVSITDGIAFGFISFSLLKLVTGRARETDWPIFVFAVLFLLRYVMLL